MSYVNNRRRRQARRALGDAISEYVTKGATALTTAKMILDDPALPQVATLITEMHNLEPKTGAGGAPAPGIGLNKLVKPLRAYVYTRRHSWALPVAIAAAFSVPFLLGYGVGRRR
jgi:hypothetical protein